MPTVGLNTQQPDDDWLQGLFAQQAQPPADNFPGAGLSLNGYQAPPQIMGHVPASGAPLNTRTLALRPNQPSLDQGDLTSSDWVGQQVYNWLQGHPGLGVPEQGQENLAGLASGVNAATPWGSGEAAYHAAARGDLPGVVGGIMSAVPIIPGAKAISAAEDVGGQLLRHSDAAFPEGRIATTTPWSAALKDSAHASNDATIGLDTMQDDPKFYAKTAGVIRAMPDIHVDPDASLDDVHQALIDHAKSNILALHDSVPDDIKAGSQQWYDGANSLAQQRAKQYGVPLENAAGAYAALSPQMDWYKNVSLGDRVMDIVHNQGDTPFTPQMATWADAYSTRKGANAETADIYDNLKGKTLNELSDPYEQAHWVRAFDEAHNDKAYNIVNPDGSFGDNVTTKSGDNANVGWGSMKAIANSISAFTADDMPTVSRSMGDGHKVRSFYNNIVAPNSDAGDVTVDTHAIAAANLRPFSGADPEVTIGLGTSGPGSSATGAKGLYGAYAEAYRQAAAERGVLPRQMQSISWEALRGLWSPSEKSNAAVNANVDNLWSAFGRGDLSRPEVQQKLIGNPSRIRPPSWYTGAPETEGG